MPYKFLKNYLAPKCTEEDNIDMSFNSHMIVWDRCNFRCSYCIQTKIDMRKKNQYYDLTENQFIATILSLMESGKNFKFSGGEPTLNPKLERHMKIVKDLGGTTFLDTNGSRPDIVKNLLDKGLVDVLAISSKGLTPEACLDNAKIKRQDFCWDNPFKCMEYGTHTPGVKVIITHVCMNDVTIEELRRFADLLEPFPNIYYKINNLFGEDLLEDFTSVDTEKVVNLMHQLQEERPQWKGRMIYVNDPSGISHYDRIRFF